MAEHGTKQGVDGVGTGTPLDDCAAVEARHLTHHFSTRTGPMRVLDDVSLTVPTGRFVSIVGPSGCGKTTFLNLVCGLEEHQSGDIRTLGGHPNPAHPSVSYMMARDALLPWRTTIQNVELALEFHAVPKRERRARALEMLQHVGLAEHSDAYRAELSQGMRQRVALARSLVAEPSLLLLDEPFAALDAQTKIAMQGLLLRLLGQQERISVVLITHDLAEAIALGDTVALFTRRPGRIKDVFEVPLPRPRESAALQADPTFHSIYRTIWESLSEEVNIST